MARGYVEAVCRKCGSSIEASKGKESTEVKVTMCFKCGQKQYEEGFNDGYEKGYNDSELDLIEPL